MKNSRFDLITFLTYNIDETSVIYDRKEKDFLTFMEFLIRIKIPKEIIVKGKDAYKYLDYNRIAQIPNAYQMRIEDALKDFVLQLNDPKYKEIKTSRGVFTFILKLKENKELHIKWCKYFESKNKVFLDLIFNRLDIEFTEATKNEYKELLDALEKYYSLKPWETFSDQDAIHLVIEKTDYYVCIMGKSDITYGICIYTGFEGLNYYRTTVHREDTFKDDGMLVSTLQKYFAIYFDKTDELLQVGLSKNLKKICDGKIACTFNFMNCGKRITGRVSEINTLEYAHIINFLCETLKEYSSSDFRVDCDENTFLKSKYLKTKKIYQLSIESNLMNIPAFPLVDFTYQVEEINRVQIQKKMTLYADIRYIYDVEDKEIADKSNAFYMLVLYNPKTEKIVFYSITSGEDFYIFSKLYKDMNDFFKTNDTPEIFITPSVTTLWFLESAFEKYQNDVSIVFKNPIPKLDEIFDELLDNLRNNKRSNSFSFKA